MLMRQKQMSMLRLCQLLSATVLLGAVAFAGVSCNRVDPNAPRSEYIEVYDSLDDEAEPKTAFSISVKADTTVFYVRTNVDPAKIEVEWQDASTSPWAKVVGVEQQGKGLLAVSVAAGSRTTYGYYTRRSGMLMIYARELNLGSYITIHQGCVARFANDCANFKYGAADPNITDGETIYSAWNSNQKGYFSTQSFGTGTISYLFGRYGYLKLGDALGHGACLITPYTNDIAKDSLLMVSFRAVAYNDATTKDNNKFTVEIIGGGEYRDFEESVKKMEFTAPYYDINDPDYPANIWNDGEFMLFFRGTDANKLSSNTQIKITAGSLTEKADVNSRLFVTRVYIRRLDVKVDEDYFEMNGGSGIDTILGLTSEEREDDTIIE